MRLFPRIQLSGLGWEILARRGIAGYGKRPLLFVENGSRCGPRMDSIIYLPGLEHFFHRRMAPRVAHGMYLAPEGNGILPTLAA